MPELPEVETIRRQLVPELVGLTIVDGLSHASDKFTPATDAIGHLIDSIDRRGKYLLIGLSSTRELVIHLGMTGVLRVVDTPTDDAYVRAAWLLSDTRWFEFRDVRRFGRIRVVDRGDYTDIATLAALGPEPFDPAFTAEHLYQALRKSSRRVKTQLLSQRPVAGVGNIYADEALWQAQIHPASRTITRAESVRLHAAIVDRLAAGVRNGGTTLRDYRDASGGMGTNQHALRCYGRSQQPCLACETPLKASVWDARTTTWCPTCQARR